MGLWGLPLSTVGPLRLRRAVREDAQGGYRLETDGRPLDALLGLLDDDAVSTLDVRALVLTKSLSAKTAPALAGNPHLARFAALRIIDQKLGDAAFASIVGSPHARGLRELSLQGTDVDREGLAALAGASCALESLAIGGASPPDEALAAFLRSERARSLRELFLARPIGEQSLAALVESPALAGLERLILTRSKLGDGDLAALRRASFAGLRSLRLSDARLGKRGLEHLAAAPFAGNLERLFVSGGPLDDAGLGALSRADALPALRELALVNTWVRGEGLEGVVAAHPTLRALQLWGALDGPPAGDAAARAAATLPALERLDLSGSSVTNLGLAALSGSTAPLRELVLSRNRIGASGAAKLAESALTTGLEVLELDAYPTYDKLGPRGGAALAKASFERLRALRLRKQYLGSDAAAALAARLPALTSLDLGDCDLGGAVVPALGAAPFASTLRELDLSFDALGDDAGPLTERLPALRKLGLASTGLGDDGLRRLLEHAGDALAELDLDYDAGLTDAAIDALLAKAGQLLDVSLVGTPAISAAKKKELASALLPPPKPKAQKKRGA